MSAPCFLARFQRGESHFAKEKEEREVVLKTEGENLVGFELSWSTVH